MMIYIVVDDKVDSDLDLIPQLRKDKAIEGARRIAKLRCEDNSEYIEHDSPNEDCLFFAEYSSQGDSIMVLSREIT